MLQPSRAVVLDPDESYSLYVTAKCYTPTSSNLEGMTLVLLHSTSFHKETWEPFIEDLFRLLERSNKAIVREAWVIECPNHGESAVLNETRLLQPEFHNNFTCRKYAEAAHRFLTAHPNTGSGIDFKSRNIVGIGHSLGGVAMIFLQDIEPKFTFRRIILVEPMLNPANSKDLDLLRSILVNSARRRRTEWKTHEDALKYFSERRTSKGWDPRVIEAFVNKATRKTDHGTYALCCTKEQEVGMYEESDGPVTAVPILTEVCRRIPVHILYGGKKDKFGIPALVQRTVLDPKFRTFASTGDIEGVGHLVPQERPAQLAEKIYKTLLTLEARAKL